MKKNTFSILSVAVVLMLALSACASLPALSTTLTNRIQASASKPVVLNSAPAQQATVAPTPTVGGPVTSSSNLSLLDAYQGTLENVYSALSPSVVNIQVVINGSASSGQGRNSPFGSSNQASQALGSGFVWDTQGHIVTNNHVIDGATKITVTFSDGTEVPAQVVGADPTSDLAVIKVNVPASQLKPVQMADSKEVKVGQVAIAIGNPFGLQGTMTVGIVSALGRSISASDGTTNNGNSYSIPDIIQTDAPINPGNSGGVLVNDQGQVIGVTAAIESSTNSNSGIGFAIPADTVRTEVPSLIQNGHFDHPYLGISGTNLTTEMATAMKLNANTRGALVEDVTQGGPAAQAGLRGSTGSTTVDGQNVAIGGDVITAINGQAVKSMDDLISLLGSSTKVGDKVALTIIRDGKEQTVNVTLQARPATVPQSSQTLGQGQGGQTSPSGTVYIGIQGLDLTSEIDQAMQLPSDQQGVLIERVTAGGPAAKAGLRASSTPATISGQTVMVGGDVIVAVDGNTITQSSDLTDLLSQFSAGQKVQVTIIRGGKTQQVTVTLASR